ncbi:MAG: ribulokinase [Chloroflexi bacterium]|nr:ribulokinase [Chloroflexota bacterium]
MKRYSIGLDFGTESVRAILVDVSSGEVAAAAVHTYPHGVIDRNLPHSHVSLPPDWVLQDPQDWLAGVEVTIRQVMSLSGVPKEAVVGIGIDFTSCTVLPVTAAGMPLCQVPQFKDDPHAWVKLWKHHAAQGQANRINQVAADRKEPWLPLYGGKISSEWMMPKALQILEEAPQIYAAADFILEGADWVVWQMTGDLRRNACGAGYKATWHKSMGFPNRDFLVSLEPEFANLYESKVAGPVMAPGELAGCLTPAWADRLGLPKDLPVAIPIIDAHSAVLGAGITLPGTMLMIMGTSTCHMLMSDREVLVPGISGVVEDGIVPGLYGYEAGQAGVGDIFAWFVEQGVPATYHSEAKTRNISLHTLLSEKASRYGPGENGLLALDWWNGCRTPLVDAGLSGLLVGATLSTEPEDIYRALIEATAFGTRLIVESFTDRGVPIENIVAGGGLVKNPFLMQIYADVTERKIAVAGTGEVSALGAAMLGAVAAGAPAGGWNDLTAAAAHMASPPAKTYLPSPDAAPAYRRLYAEYCRLVDYFGRGGNPVMKTLRELKKS